MLDSLSHDQGRDLLRLVTSLCTLFQHLIPFRVSFQLTYTSIFFCDTIWTSNVATFSNLVALLSDYVHCFSQFTPSPTSTGWISGVWD